MRQVATVNAWKWIHEALITEMEDRSINDDWVQRERIAVVVAANQWAEIQGLPGRVSLNDVERVEPRAMGHVDYARKLALEVAELLAGDKDAS